MAFPIKYAKSKKQRGTLTPHLNTILHIGSNYRVLFIINCILHDKVYGCVPSQQSINSGSVTINRL